MIQAGLPALKGRKVTTVLKVRPALKEPMARSAPKVLQAIQVARRDHKATMVLKVRKGLREPMVLRAPVM